jgi:hypothetical protein
MKDFVISLTAEEANAVLQSLGNLPTSSGVYPLLMKIKQQCDDQVKAREAIPSVPA